MSGQPARLSVELHGLQLSSDTSALVLGPAIGTTAQMWHPVLPYLTDVPVVLYSMRGHGGSEFGPGPYSLSELADDVVAVMDQLGLGRAHHAGVSLGGMVAMELGLRHPERVRSLCIIASSAHPGNRDSWIERAATAREHGLAGLADASMERWFTADFLEDPEARATHLAFLGVEPEAYAACCEALADIDLRAELGAVTAPTLVIAGADDQALPPAHSQVIADAIPGATMATVAGCAHLPPTQQPRAVAELLRGFLGLPPVA